MKIGELKNKSGGLTGLNTTDSVRMKAGAGESFSNQLVRAQESSYEQHLERLVTDIVRQGEVLARKVDIRELKVYRKLISEFLALAVGNSKKFFKKSLLDRRGRHRVYAIVKTINEELDKLTEEVIKGETDNINLLKRLDDIRGLILDLFM